LNEDGKLALMPSPRSTMNSDFLDREQELAQLTRLLQAERPCLVALTGEAGVGKTALLEEVRNRLAEEIIVIPPTVAGKIIVGRDLVPESFCDQLLKWFTATGNQDQSEFPSGPDCLNQVINQIQRTTLVILEGYRPNEAFASWFQNDFAAQIRANQSPVVVVIATLPDQAEKTAAWTDETIHLKPVDPILIKQHFETIGSQMAPPPISGELEKYIQKTQERPEILPILSRLLRLTWPGPS
jgi:hypothetical protein